MKQNINLYQPAARRSGGLDGRAVLIVWALTLLVATAAQFWLGQRNDRVAHRLQAMQQDVTSLDERLNEMAAAMMSGDDTVLEAQLNEALRELDLRETILGLVSGNSAGDVDGFSGQLRSLARQNAEGIWLTRVRISSPGARMTLEGRALSPETVPLYLRQLSGEAALAGQRFDMFEIQRPEKTGEAIRFSLNRSDDTDSVQLVRK